MGEPPGDPDFQLIPGLSKTISLYSGLNTLSITARGIAQVNSAATDTVYQSYSIALFVDSKLTRTKFHHFRN